MTSLDKTSLPHRIYGTRSPTPSSHSLVKIFTFLPLEDILNLRLVSKYIETMTHENAIWKSLYYAEKGWKIYEPPVPEIRESSRRMSTPWHGPNWISKGKAAVFDRPASPSNMITSFKDTVKITETTVHSPMKGIETASKKENLESPISPCYQDLISQPINWTQVYMERTILEKRWLEGEATSSICFSAHTEAIYCCQLIHERIITGSRDKTVKFWSTSPGSAEPPALVYSINDAHTMSVLCLQVDPVGGQEGKGFMVTGSSDATVGVWDLKGVLLLKPGDKCKNKPKKIKTLNGHDGGVLDIVFNEEKILSWWVWLLSRALVGIELTIEITYIAPRTRPFAVSFTGFRRAARFEYSLTCIAPLQSGIVPPSNQPTSSRSISAPQSTAWLSILPQTTGSALLGTEESISGILRLASTFERFEVIGMVGMGSLGWLVLVTR